MGLDMYLYAKRYLFTYPEDSEDSVKAKQIAELFPEFASGRVKFVETEIGYWRKANQIHQWFVDNVQDGVDNCSEYYVNKDQLIELSQIVDQILDSHREDPDNHELAEELLPTANGFFFGSTEYADWYYSDLEETKEILDKVLANEQLLKTCDIYYRASW